MQTKTIASANLADANDFKTSIATAITAQSYSDEELDGAAIEPGGPSHGFAYYPSVTTSSAAGAYTDESTVVFTGKYRGQTVQRTATITDTDAGATYIADGPMEGVPSLIEVAAQADTDGALTFGWSGIAPASMSKPASTQLPDSSSLRLFKKVVSQGTGSVVVGYSDNSTDTISTVLGFVIDSDVRRIFATTAVAVTIFY